MSTVHKLVLLFGIATFALPIHAALPADLQPLAFLLGDWQAAANTGVPGEGTGTCGFHPGLQDRVIVRTNHADYPSSGGRPAVAHDDLMIVYAAGAGEVRADYYDSEGHVIRYKVAATQGGEVVFLSDASAPGPRYRLTYVPRKGGAVGGEFSMAPPGSAGDFKNYLTWEMRKQPKAK